MKIIAILANVAPLFPSQAPRSAGDDGVEWILLAGTIIAGISMIIQGIKEHKKRKAAKALKKAKQVSKKKQKRLG